MSYSTRTLVLAGAGIALAAGLAYVSFRTDPVPVDLAEVTRGPLEVTVNADGKTRVRELFEIASPITGTAQRSPVDVGDTVVAGQTIVAVVEPVAPDLLDDRTRREAEAALEEARAALHVSEADLKRSIEERSFAQSQHDRTKALLERGAATATQLEDASQRLAVAKAGAQAARARIKMALGQIHRAEARLMAPANLAEKDESCCIQVTSTASGVVMSIDTISERPVLAGAPLLSVGDPTDLELVADILSSDATQLKPGARAHVERWGGEATLQAELDRIDPAARTTVSALGIEEQRVDAYFTLLSPQEDRPQLGNEFSVFLRIVKWAEDDVLQIPLSALFRAGEDWAVFVVDDSIARLRRVELGRRNGLMTAVKAGLEAGEMVVTHPGDAVADGVTVARRSDL